MWQASSLKTEKKHETNKAFNLIALYTSLENV